LPATCTRLCWLGNSAFLVTTPARTTLLVDPFDTRLGYPNPTLPPIDVLALTHEHRNHNNIEIVSSSSTVIRGVSSNGWNPQHFTYKDLSITVVAGAYRGRSGGRTRARTAIMSIETGGVRILHMGGLGHELDVNLRAQCKDHSVVLVPIGGVVTLNGQEASVVVDSIGADISIPMHYKNPAAPNSPLAHLDESGFLDNKLVKYLKTDYIDLPSAKPPQHGTVLIPRLASAANARIRRKQAGDKKPEGSCSARQTEPHVRRRPEQT